MTSTKCKSFNWLVTLAASVALCQPSFADTTQEKLTALEKSFDGCIGGYAVNTANNERIGFRADERFLRLSTG